jgi:alkylation response protein AidB-like acyl-CoA dehydrogenase
MAPVETDDERLKAAVRQDARRWIKAHWDPTLELTTWRRHLYEATWACPTWPRECGGRGLPGWADDIVKEELAAAGAVGTPLGSGMDLAAPTILAHGSPAQKDTFLPRIVTGEDTWCQLFSEPGSGSDLAGLTTTAIRDGEVFVVNGQKVWSTSAHHAAFGMLLARTDWDAPKHKGISWMALPMRQQGVEVRPLRQMNGHASFNEVFLSDAVVPVENVVGRLGEGWPIALTTLAHERGFRSVRRRDFESGGRALEEAKAEAEAYFATYSWYPQRAGRADLVAEHARATGRQDDPVSRQAIAGLSALHHAHQWMAARARMNRELGRAPGPEGSIGKLGLSKVAREAAKSHTQLAGPAGMLVGPTSPFDGMIAEVLESVPAQSIAGGTDEIQLNITAERILGLPKEPQAATAVSFRELKRA